MDAGAPSEGDESAAGPSEVDDDDRHRVSIISQGRFLLPTCSCGWLGTARLTQAAAREEARDHALLYAAQGLSAEEFTEWIQATEWTGDAEREPADADPET